MSQEIPHSIACVGCEYDLRGLAPDSVCPECGEAIAKTLPPCPRCWTSHAEIVPMRRMASGSIGSWKCSRCGGIAFERDRLRAVVSKLPLRSPPRLKAPFDLVAQSPVDCSRCRSVMQAIVIDKRTLIDRCSGCGFIWLDPGELGALAVYLRTHLGNARAPRQIEEFLGDPDRIRAAAERRPAEQDAYDWGAAAPDLVLVILSWLFS
jgi:Zn-finger nucleic acid-binding protein